MNNRRNFLKRSLAAASVGAFASCQSHSQREASYQGYNYQLPKFAKGTRLLFQGDSITDMKWGRNQKDRNHYLGHSYVFLIASRLGVDLAEAKLEFFNRGMSGNRVQDLKKRWQKDALDLKPDLLSILVGVNDIVKSKGAPIDMKKWESDYRYLLESTLKQNPKLKVVLLNPFVLPTGRFVNNPDELKRFAESINKMAVVVTTLARDYNAVHIKTQEVFTAATATSGAENWIWDGVHPLPQGHELIARNWIDEVAKSSS
ncbi:MAG: GDSL-type esterase/lipase family protein [Lentisphaeraceae bacterium]|nr:GDSL-type esterase/lipase family protein [Lentisphaeraceae bacterium]